MEKYDIDFVIPWVDGNDPSWLDEKKKYDLLADEDPEVNSSKRYRDWNLMKYWFRGVEKFAPWVHRIHFLTWGHVPKFLNTGHPKIHIVNHREFIPADCLPTYNASAFEMALHRIPELSEHFVYFNDDTFLLNATQREDFFKNGLPCSYFEENPSFYYGNSNYGRQVYNALCVVNKHFNKHDVVKKYWKKWFSQSFMSKNLFYTLLSAPWDKFLGFPSPHLPSSFLKKTWLEVWEKEPNLLNETLHSRFRKSENVQQELFRYWQFATGNFMPQKLLGKCISLNPTSVDEACTAIQSQKFKELCLNDGNVSDFEREKKLLKESFDIVLPEKCSFEL